MQSQKKRFSTIKCTVIWVLILVFTGGLVALDESDVKVSDCGLTRRTGESEASYQARIRAAERARHGIKPAKRIVLIDKRPGETDEAYQLRLRTTIKGLLSIMVYTPELKLREGESQLSYQARCNAAKEAIVHAHFGLIAYPDEEEIAYRARLAAWKQGQDADPATNIIRRYGESEASYRARQRAVQRHQEIEGESSSQ